MYEARLMRDGRRITPVRKKTVLRAKREVKNNPLSTLYGERGSSAALQLVLAAVYRSIILQPLIDFLHVGGRQHAGGFTQLDGIDDVVIQRSRIIAAGLVQLTLRLQYFHQVTGSHLIAGLGCFQSALTGNNRLLASLYARYAGFHRQVQRAGGLNDTALGVVEELLRLGSLGQGLATLRRNPAAAEDRHVQRDAHGGSFGVDILGVAIPLTVIIVIAVTERGGDSGQVARSCPFRYLAGCFSSQTGRLEGVVILQGEFHPLMAIGGYWLYHRKLWRQRGDPLMALSGQYFQSFEADVQVATRFQGGGPGAVVGCLGFMNFRNGSQTHFEAL